MYLSNHLDNSYNACIVKRNWFRKQITTIEGQIQLKPDDGLSWHAWRVNLESCSTKHTSIASKIRHMYCKFFSNLLLHDSLHKDALIVKNLVLLEKFGHWVFWCSVGWCVWIKALIVLMSSLNTGATFAIKVNPILGSIWRFRRLNLYQVNCLNILLARKEIMAIKIAVSEDQRKIIYYAHTMKLKSAQWFNPARRGATTLIFVTVSDWSARADSRFLIGPHAPTVGFWLADAATLIGCCDDWLSMIGLLVHHREVSVVDGTLGCATPG